MRRVGRFLWVDWAQASGRAYASNGRACADRFKGEHDGYRRLGVTHRRAVQWLGGSGWVIVDDIADEVSAAEHDVCLHWLAADLPFEVADSPFQVVFAVGRGADSLEHCFECSRECRDRASWKAGCDKWNVRLRNA